MFNATVISNVATTLVGAAFCGVAALAIAVPSAHAAPAGYRQSVEASIDQIIRFPAGKYANSSGVTTLAVTVGPNGSVGNVDIVKSSGEREFDREAVRTAKAARYPATGKLQTVAMVLGFNRKTDSTAQAQGRKLVDAYRTDHRQLLANETTAQPTG